MDYYNEHYHSIGYLLSQLPTVDRVCNPAATRTNEPIANIALADGFREPDAGRVQSTAVQGSLSTKDGNSNGPQVETKPVQDFPQSSSKRSRDAGWHSESPMDKVLKKIEILRTKQMFQLRVKSGWHSESPLVEQLLQKIEELRSKQMRVKSKRVPLLERNLLQTLDQLAYELVVEEQISQVKKELLDTKTEIASCQEQIRKMLHTPVPSSKLYGAAPEVQQ